MKPHDIPVNETLGFIREVLGPRHQQLLEIGCGNGAVARRLQEDGHHITLLDASAEAVAEARALGLDAQLATWPHFDTGTTYDAVLFIRSLHHIDALAEAVNRVRDVLKPGGRLIIEDFAYNRVDEFVARWFFGLISVLHTAGAVDPGRSEFGRRLLAGGGGLDIWHDHHAEELHSEKAMLLAVDEYFDIREITPVPYLYRYFCDMVTDSARAGRVCADVLAWELNLARAVPELLIGRRVVAVPR